MNSILPKEHNGSNFFNLPIVSSSADDGVTSVALWDSSIHESAHLNRLTAPTERIFLIVKVCVRLSHPAMIDIVLRKRIAINVYKKQSLTKSIFKRISRADLPLEGTGITYEIVSSIPKASEDIEDRESLALLAASGVDLTACDGESYIERYTKSVSAVENLLQLERLRQEVAVRELLTKKAKFPVRSIAAGPGTPGTLNGGLLSASSEAFLRKTVSVPNMANIAQFGVHRPAAVNSSSPLDSTFPRGVANAANTPTGPHSRSNRVNGGTGMSDSSFDLSYSYLSSAADRLRRGATSLFGSMTGLNQLGPDTIEEERPTSSSVESSTTRSAVSGVGK